LPLLADVIRAKASGDGELTLRNIEKLSSEFGRYEERLFPYYDAYQGTYACRVISRVKD
jgi:hypothetical protein